MGSISELIEPAMIFFEVVVLALLTAPLWLRPLNEITCRTVGRAVVICPHCGVPGVIKTNHPQVLR